MLTTFRQEERIVMDRENDVIADFGVATCGDEFHWDGESLGIDLSDLECGSLMISDLHHDFDQSMKSTVQV